MRLRLLVFSGVLVILVAFANPSTSRPTVVTQGAAGAPDAKRVFAESDLAEQALLLHAFGGLPKLRKERVMEEVAAEGKPLTELHHRFLNQGVTLPRDVTNKIFRVIKDELKPLVVLEGRAVSVLPPSEHPWGIPPTGDDLGRLMTAAKSVGRIEMVVPGGTEQVLVGTGFVVGADLVATNCHVLRALVKQEQDRWVLIPGASITVDFGETSAHRAIEEYRVEGIAGFPSKPLLDVAVLRTAPRSVEGDRPLPARLTIADQALPSSATVPLVAVIGYPDLGNLRGDERTQRMFRRLREGARGNGKLLAPGAVTGVASHEGLDFLRHVASTHPGQSGSPVVSRTDGRVLGVHYCCSYAGVPPTRESLACSSQRLSDEETNEAISGWTVATNPDLRPLLFRN